MPRISTLRRLLLVSTLGLTATLLVAPLLPTTARACGPYGAITPQMRAGDAALAEHARRDRTRVAVISAVLVEGDRALVRLRIEDDAGQRFDRTMALRQTDGVWAVTRVGRVRPRPPVA